MQISEHVIKRLTLYHFILDELNNNETTISSTKIAQLLNIDASQVRKDLKILNNSGKCRVGYNTKELKRSIESSLGFKQPKNAFIIGAGNLGSALAKYNSFKDYGLNILAMFDSDSKKIGTTINGKPVYDVTQIKDFIKNLSVDIAILTVPKEYAQNTANLLVEYGIKYIWNFTPCVLNITSTVRVWNENLIGSFLQFLNNDENLGLFEQVMYTEN